MRNMYELIELEVIDQEAYIKLNRPQSLNALNSTMIQEIVDCLKTISCNDQVKVVILQGNDNAFSAGGDIKEMLTIQGEEPFAAVMKNINDMMTILYEMPKLTIAAVEGAAAGLGLSLALAADHIICHDKSKLAMNFIGIGLMPDGGGHFFLKRRIGEEKAKKLIWEGKILTAAEAKHIGLIDETTDYLQTAVKNRLEKWKRKPLLAMIETKNVYTQLHREQLRQTLALETKGQWKMRQTVDHQEGIKAFVEKREPHFIGG
ncbi:enoyl-CoA hydratase [Bacillus chungangensis]|uniref:Enoyl-CoA hydratase/carnithine racemase n=1 Tax=Bacillus chungangensis TaxID=587633 RepID=A0ABT9WND7_9BACI|nr:enoyl-CoA hydratase [Bacillus chungangensis]MDQ0174802.1 enoyl-CoA hydratase/carnithine racemase [Bacillus chungangensis]